MRGLILVLAALGLAECPVVAQTRSNPAFPATGTAAPKSQKRPQVQSIIPSQSSVSSSNAPDGKTSPLQSAPADARWPANARHVPLRPDFHRLTDGPAAPANHADRVAALVPATAEGTGLIAGGLSDINGQSLQAGGAVVFLCDAATGNPIDGTTKQPNRSLLKTGSGEAQPAFWFAVLDDRGSFEFRDVPPGRYRLIAQSWTGTTGLPKVMGRTSKFIVLHGAADDVEVKAGEKTVVFLRQPGEGMLRIKTNPPSPNAFLVVSLARPLGDPILGIAGWGPNFTRQVIGVTHMAGPDVILFGVPEHRDLHVAYLNYDNSPGVAGGTFQAGPQDATLWVLAGWSNGHDGPPARLKPLRDQLIEQKLTAGDFLSEEEILANVPERLAAQFPKEDAQTSPEVKRRTRESLLKYSAPAALVQIAAKDPDREVDVPGLGKHKLIDVAAALAYVQLREFHRQRKQRALKAAPAFDGKSRDQ